MNNFVNAMDRTNNYTLTENGALALNTTNNGLLDAFGTLGALRDANNDTIINMFMKAFDENETLALKLLFYVRDCREGLGERHIFKTVAEYLADNYADSIKRNLEHIPFYGRWDDLLCFIGTKLESDVITILKSQFNNDMRSVNTPSTCSLLGKWLPSCNTSSKTTRRLGLKLAKEFGLTEKEYRKSLTALRKKIDVVEAKMSSNNWTTIDYEAVPSKAHNTYRNAFARHDYEGYGEYMDKVEDGEAKINASVLYPYDLTEKYMPGHSCLYYKPRELDEVIEAQWKALPNFVTNANEFLCVVDVSGSMQGRPMATSVGLGIYFAQRTTSAFHNRMITFSENPSWIEIKDKWSLNKCVEHVMNSEWGGSTNLEATFELILNTAIENHITQEDMPKNIVVITDMEIDRQWNHNDDDSKLLFMEDMEQRFNDAGYQCPQIVWWNVSARHNVFHADYTNKNARFISGQSASVFKQLCENLGESALDMVYNTLMSERYSIIV